MLSHLILNNIFKLFVFLNDVFFPLKDNDFVLGEVFKPNTLTRNIWGSLEPTGGHNNVFSKKIALSEI